MRKDGDLRVIIIIILKQLNSINDRMEVEEKQSRDINSALSKLADARTNMLTNSVLEELACYLRQLNKQASSSPSVTNSTLPSASSLSYLKQNLSWSYVPALLGRLRGIGLWLFLSSLAALFMFILYEALSLVSWLVPSDPDAVSPPIQQDVQPLPTKEAPSNVPNSTLSPSDLEGEGGHLWYWALASILSGIVGIILYKVLTKNRSGDNRTNDSVSDEGPDRDRSASLEILNNLPKVPHSPVHLGASPDVSGTEQRGSQTNIAWETASTSQNHSPRVPLRASVFPDPHTSPNVEGPSTEHRASQTDEGSWVEALGSKNLFRPLDIGKASGTETSSTLTGFSRVINPLYEKGEGVEARDKTELAKVVLDPESIRAKDLSHDEEQGQGLYSVTPPGDTGCGGDGGEG